MRQAIALILMAAFLVLIGAKCPPPEEPKQIDFEANGFQQIKVTAYCCGTHTATGVPVHYGCMAVSKEHLGDCAFLYTLDGEYIDLFEGNDQGGTDAIRESRVVDVYFPTLEECQEFMARTQGKCWIKYVEGVG